MNPHLIFLSLKNPHHILISLFNFMSSLKRRSSEYSSSYDSQSTQTIKKKEKLSREEKSKARRHLYKLCFKDWLAIIGIIPALAQGIVPILFVYFSTDIIDALQYWGTSLTCVMTYSQLAQAGQDPSYLLQDPTCGPYIISYSQTGGLYDPMPTVILCIKKMAGVAAGGALSIFLITFLWTMVGNRIQNRMKINMYTNLMKSEIAYFDITPIGNILTLLSEDTEAIQVSFGTIKATQISAIVQGIAGLIFAFIREWRIAFVSIVFIPVIGIALLCIIPSLLKLSAKKFIYVSESMTIAEETLGAIRTVRGFNREKIESKRFMKATTLGAKQDRGIGLLIVLFLFIVLISIVADVLGDFYYGATFVDKGELGFGDLTTLFMYTLLGSLGVVSLQGTMQGEEKALAAGARILEVTEHIPDIPFDGGKKIKNFKGEIEFRNVSFKYPTRDAYVLKNVSFKINQKQIGALVGHSGSGKSTCVQLLERFYDATEGVVLLDGHDIRTLDQHWLHQKTALVSQEPILFRKTLRDNIKYGCHNATDEEILKAIEVANAKRVLEKLEKGLDTLVGEKGSSLSGGQRQRIAIARAVVKKPTILITDEATSALDAQSEKKVQIALDKVMQDCTSVIVAHRLSTIRNADIIYVFDAGEIKESGTHDELVKKGGYYYNLVYRQLTEKDAENRKRAIEDENEDTTESSSSDDNETEETSKKHKKHHKKDEKHKKHHKKDKKPKAESENKKKKHEETSDSSDEVSEVDEDSESTS